jgi:hypothetical protein
MFEFESWDIPYRALLMKLDESTHSLLESDDSESRKRKMEMRHTVTVLLSTYASIYASISQHQVAAPSFQRVNEYTSLIPFT